MTTNITSMTSIKPHLICAYYDWIVDNQLTPYIVVDTLYPGVSVPQEHVHNGQIVLNISPEACRGLILEKDRILFSARFGGKVEQVFIPPLAIFEIYAKENGRGTSFPPEDYTAVPVVSPEKTQPARSKPALRLVQKEEDQGC